MCVRVVLVVPSLLTGETTETLTLHSGFYFFFVHLSTLVHSLPTPVFYPPLAGFLSSPDLLQSGSLTVFLGKTVLFCSVGSLQEQHRSSSFLLTPTHANLVGSPGKHTQYWVVEDFLFFIF